MYLFGEGVEKDYQKAFNYYNLIHQSKDSFYKRITGGEISIFYGFFFSPPSWLHRFAVLPLFLHHILRL